MVGFRSIGRRLWPTVIVLVLCGAVYMQNTPFVYSLTLNERKVLAQEDISFVDDACPVIASTTPTAESASEDNVIRSIIGIAKSYNLPKEAAVIGVMTAMTESHFKIMANSTVPASEENPAWLALPAPRPIGND